MPRKPKIPAVVLDLKCSCGYRWTSIWKRGVVTKSVVHCNACFAEVKTGVKV